MNSSRDSVSFSDAPDVVDVVDDDDDDDEDDGEEEDAVVVVGLSLSRLRDGGTITGKVKEAAVVTGGERVYEADALTILLLLFVELSEEFRDSLGLIVNVAVISLFISSVFGFGDGILSLSFDDVLGVVVVVVVDDVDGVFCDSVSVCI